MIAGALLSGWRGRSAMNKGLLTLLLLFTCFAHAQVVDTAIRQSATTATGVKYCQPVTLSAVPESKLTGIQRAGGCQYAPSGLQHGGGGKNEVEIIGWMTERYGDFVRYNPPLTGQTLVLWALPVVLLLLMALILWRVRAKR